MQASQLGSSVFDERLIPKTAPLGLSVLTYTVPNMDEMRTSGVILAALELAPAEPSDVTAILLDSSDRQALLGPDEGCGLPVDESSAATQRHVSPLARYLADHIDQGRIEYWTKIVDRGASEGRYRPTPVTSVGYPRRLRDERDAPPLLFCSLAETDGAGRVAPGHSALSEEFSARPSLAIVGSRKASPPVVASTECVASDLAAAGVAIVSGLAAGVDAAAHRGALAGCGYTVAVLGTGIDHVYPGSNRSLAAEIRRVGTLVSQFAPPAPRTPTSFLLRNHVIAAMSCASLVMDAGERSGSRYEVERALDYGRPVFAWAPVLSHSPWVKEIVRTRGVRLVESSAEIAQHLAHSQRESGS